MKKNLLLFILFLVLFLMQKIDANASLPPKYWEYELKPYYSKIIAVNSNYFVLEKIINAGGIPRKIYYLYDDEKNKYTPINRKYLDIQCLSNNGAGFYSSFDKATGRKLFGFLNFDKKIYLKPKYMKFFPFHKGSAVVQDATTEKYSVINESGVKVLGPFPDFITSLDEKNYRLKRVNILDNAYHSHHEYVYTDAFGKPIFAGQKFLSAHGFNNGYAMVATDRGFCGYINTSGKLAIPYKYTNCSTFINGSALVYEPKTKKTLILDKHLKTFEVKGEYGEFVDQFLQKHDPNGLVLYSKFTNIHKGKTLPKYYKTIYLRDNLGNIIAPAGLYYEGEHVYRGYYVFKKYELKRDDYGAFLVKSNKPVLIHKSGKVYENYEKAKVLGLPPQCLLNFKDKKIMLLDKDISGDHSFSWVNFNKNDNIIQVLEKGRYGLIKLTKNQD